MKRSLRTLLRHCGFELLRRSDDPVLDSLLETYAALRLQPDDFLAWDNRLPHLASLGHLRSQLRRQAIDLVLDVGANRGQFALDARRAGYTGEIVSFEPLAAHQPTLRDLAVKDGRWRILPFALGAAREEKELNVYRDDTFSSLLPANAHASQTFGALVALDHTERVVVRTLDDVCAELGIAPSRRVLLKTDTQGHDLAVLAGARTTLAQARVVITEATLAPLYDGAGHLEHFDALLLPLGFARAGVFPIGYSPASHTLLETDCFYSRPEPCP